MKYAVTFIYSFDGYSPVFPFETEEAAKDFLKTSFEEECNIDQNENGWDSHFEISDDGWKAKIVNYLPDGEDTTLFVLGVVQTPGA